MDNFNLVAIAEVAEIVGKTVHTKPYFTVR